MRILYHLYTERRDNLPSLTARHFAGATFTPSTGLWRGKLEPSTVIEIVGSDKDRPEIKALSDDIKATNHQDAVLLTSEPIRSEVL